MQWPCRAVAFALLLTATVAAAAAEQGHSTAGTIWLWETDTGKRLQQFDGHTRQVVAVDVAADGRQVLSGSRDGTVRLWDAETGKEQRRHETGTARVSVVKFTPDQKSALFSTPDGIIHRWNLHTGEIERQYRPKIKVDYEYYCNDHLIDLAFSDDTERFTCCSRKGGVAAWELKSGAPIGRVAKCTMAASADLRGDLQRIVIGRPLGWSDGGRLGVVDVATGDNRWFSSEPIARYKRGISDGARYDQITAVEFSPNGKVAISGSERGAVRLWEVLGGKQLRQFYGHEGMVNCVRMSPDGKFGLSGGCDGKVLLWDLLHEAAVRRFIGNEEEVTCLAFSGDGSRMASAGGSTSPSKVVKSEVAGTAFAAAQPQRVLAGLDQPWSIAVDSKDEKIYWCADSTIYRANVDGSEIEEILVGLKEPHSLAIDERARRMFWLERNNFPPTIHHSQLDGSDRKSLDMKDNVQPQGVAAFALHPDSEQIYLVAPNYGPRIRRCDYEGEHVEDIVLAGLGDVRTIDVDPVEGKVYWTDLDLGKIKRANLDGTRVETIYTERTPGESLHNLVVDSRSRKIYWLQKWQYGGGPISIRGADLDGANVEVLALATHEEDGPPGAIYTFRGKLASNYFYQFAVDARGGWLYWTSHPSDKILRVPMSRR